MKTETKRTMPIEFKKITTVRDFTVALLDLLNSEMPIDIKVDPKCAMLKVAIFDEGTFNKFITAYEQIRNLWERGVLSDEIYNLWLKEQVEKLPDEELYDFTKDMMKGKV